MPKQWLLISSFTFLFAFVLKAQTPLEYRYFNISTLTQDDGLSQGSNYFRFEDSQGFMWITCNDAINRFDGKMVKVYKKNMYFKNCAPLKQGYGIVEDASGNIYVGSSDGLYIYRRDQDRFTLKKIFINTIDNNTIPFAYKDNKIWCYNRQYKIASFDVTTKKTDFYEKVQLEDLSSIHAYLQISTQYFYRQPFFDKNGVIWIANKNMLASYNIKKNIVKYHLADFLTKSSLTLQGCCYSENNNCILFGVEIGILKYNLGEEKIILIKEIDKKKLGLIDEISCFGKNFLAKNGNELIIINDSFTQIYRFYPRNNNITGSNYLNCKPDKNNRLWLCANGSGLVIIDFNKKSFFNETMSIDGINYFNKKGVNGFAEADEKGIYIRSGTNLFYQDKSSKEIIQIFNDTCTEYTFICPDTKRNGFWYYNSKEIIFYKNNEPTVLKIKGENDFYGLLQDMCILPNGSLLTAFSKGLFIYDTTQNKLLPITNMPIENPFKINLLSKNRVAVSYLNNSMIEASVVENKLFPLHKILPEKQAFYITENIDKNQYWVGTDNGLYLLDSTFKILKKIDADNDLAGTYIYGLLSDDFGNIWVSHEKGISSIDDNSYEITNFGKKDGIQDWDFNNRSFYKASDGTLYFGGVNGYNYFKPPVVRKKFYKPEVYIDEIFVNNKPFIPDTNYNYINKINLPLSKNNISFHAVVKDLDLDFDQEIIYRMKGIDATWQHLSNNSMVVFNNLAAGKYILELGASNTNTKEDRSQKLIYIDIVPPFYQTILFYIVVAVLLTSISVWLYANWKFRKRKQKLEYELTIEEERNRITSDLHDEIGSTLSSLQLYSAAANKLVETDKDKTKKLLENISIQSSKILDTIGDIIWSMKTDKEQFISVSSRIKNFVSDVLGSADIDYTIEIDEGIEKSKNNMTAKKNIVLIVKEAVNNCLKYSKADHVKVFILEDTMNLIIQISDNGIGIEDAEYLKGNGISNMRKRSEELNGNFEIVSSPKKGTTIICKIPIANIRDGKS